MNIIEQFQKQKEKEYYNNIRSYGVGIDSIPEQECNESAILQRYKRSGYACWDKYTTRISSDTGKHSHDTNEMFVVVEGICKCRLYVAIDTTIIFALGSGDFISIPKGLVHRVKIEENTTIIRFFEEPPHSIVNVSTECAGQ
jgi:mannose-6-phosphate isomerase-like protein (cupin superfamily)